MAEGSKTVKANVAFYQGLKPGQVGDVPSDLADAAIAAGFATEVTGSDDLAPAKSARKDEWVAHAVAQGADPEEVEGMTKVDIVSEFGED